MRYHYNILVGGGEEGWFAFQCRYCVMLSKGGGGGRRCWFAFQFRYCVLLLKGKKKEGGGLVFFPVQILCYLVKREEKSALC